MSTSSNKIITIPNIISVFRLLLIAPIFITFLNGHYLASLILIVVSGVSDVVDGIIARKFGMVSEVGKILDPIVDKLTQISIIALLSSKQLWLLVPCVILIIKELTSGFIGLWIVRRIGHMLWADWHGKLSTVFLYVMMGAHMLMLVITGEINLTISYITIAVSTVLMALSFTLYLVKYIGIIKQIKDGKIEKKEAS